LHQRIAEALDGLHPGDSEYVYAVARHYELGDLADPGRAYRAAISAGRLALLNHAPDRTLEFLDGAAAAAEAGGIVSGIEFHEPYGVACVRVGRFAEARGHLHEALAAETDPVRRAMLHGMICESYVNDWELADALSAADDALAAINRRLPGNPAVLALSTLWSFLLSLLVKWTGIGYGTATGVTRERLRIEALVLAHAAQAAVSAHRMSLVACLQFRQLYPANRIGYGPEYVKAHGTMATVVKMMGRPRLAARMFRRIKAIAAELADPRLVAGVDWYSATIETTLRNSPVDVAAVFRRLLIEHGPWLDGQQLFNAASILCNQLTQQGHTIEAQAWYDRVKARTNEVELGPGHLMTLVTVPIRSIMGSGAKVLGDSVMGSSVMGSSVMGGGGEARSQLRSAREFLATRPDNREQAVNYLMQALICAVELGDLGESFEDLAHQVEAMRLTPRNTWPAQHQIWASIAYGRLKQAQTAPGHELPARLERARIAVKRLGKAATTPMLKVHLQITRASLSLLAGDPEKAFGLLEDAERKSRGIDAPVLQFEISRVRARALQAIGNPSQARQYARLALQLANECGWGSRVQAIQTEYGLSGSGAQPGTGAGAVTAEMYRHRLDALQQVSLAAVTVLDPRELARVALQETMGILGAERAFLFLVETGTEAESGTEVESSTAVDSGAEQLVPFLGRTAAGEELEKLTGYGASLVNRVRQTGEPLVVTGNEDGEAYGSQSALIHGLRSVLVAPLRLNDRLLGVVYLDSRVAKGIFTRDDVDILMAITNNIAVSLETARAAQLEAAARAAGQQRDLAERLRSSMTEVSATLDPDEVLRRLLRAAAEALPGDGACLLRSTAGGYTVVDVSGVAPAEAIGRAVDQEDLEMVTALANQPTATSGSAMPGAAMAGQPRPPAALLPDVRSWIAVPLSARRAAVGVLVVASRADDTYSDAHLQIAGALAGQGMSAYDNAELFAQVTRMATVDAMTGVSNRRHFLTLAAEAFTRLRANGQPFTAMMLDIDHFKQVNDTYGHLVGDTVIEEVGARLRSVTRNGDLLGRYGGEEFALLLTADPGHAEEAAERLLNAVRRTPIETAAGPLQLTVSIGMAHGAHGDSDLGALLARADDALYRAKQGGRNRAAAA
jgi:diguanylate cyclase (GGDEF)-like protein